MPRKKLDRSIFRIRNPKPDNPGEWAIFLALEQRGDDGRIVPDGLLRGLESRREMLRAIEAGQSKLEAAGITITASAKVTINAGGICEISAGTLNVSAGLSRFSGVVQADTVISNSVISASYTPGAGNIW